MSFFLPHHHMYNILNGVKLADFASIMGECLAETPSGSPPVLDRQKALLLEYRNTLDGMDLFVKCDWITMRNHVKQRDAKYC